MVAHREAERADMQRAVEVRFMVSRLSECCVL